eukprot:2116257-Amphidinium_carterae.1
MMRKCAMLTASQLQLIERRCRNSKKMDPNGFSHSCSSKGRKQFSMISTSMMIRLDGTLAYDIVAPLTPLFAELHEVPAH